MTTDLESRLRNLAAAAPAPDLRERVLAKAGAASPPRVSKLDLLWFSRRLRVAVAGLAVVFVLFSFSENRLLERRLEAFFAEPPAPRGDDLRSVARELGVETGLRERILDNAWRDD